MSQKQSDGRAVYIYKYTETLPFIMYWEADVVILFSTVMVSGYIFAKGVVIFAFLGAAFYGSKLYQKAKNIKAKGFVWHQIYKFGLRGTPEGVIPSHERIFIGG
jgi:hypothetical protein